MTKRQADPDPFATVARRISLAPAMRDEAATRIMRAFAAKASKDSPRALFVGGCVRDSILGIAPHDIDIATPLNPRQVASLLQQADIRTIATGLAHGTWTALVGKRHFEVTSLRRDVETFGRHARVDFGASWIDDAQRRDFTINALYCTMDGDVFDPWGGLADLENRHVRFIGDADERIREDRLRILRFFRFHARFGGACPDADGVQACMGQASGLADLSKERVRMELFGILALPKCAAIFSLMQRTGILRPILPTACRPQILERLLALQAALNRHQGQAPDQNKVQCQDKIPGNTPGNTPGKNQDKNNDGMVAIMVRLAALLGGQGDTSWGFQKRLRLSRRESDRLAFLLNAPTLSPATLSSDSVSSATLSPDSASSDSVSSATLSPATLSPDSASSDSVSSATLSPAPASSDSARAASPRAFFHGDIRALLYHWGRDKTRDALLLNLARYGTTPYWPLIARQIDTLAIPVFPLKGKDMHDLGYTSGPALGRALKRAEQWWITHDYPNRDVLLDQSDHWQADSGQTDQGQTDQGRHSSQD